jgi:hypothetical protein
LSLYECVYPLASPSVASDEKDEAVRHSPSSGTLSPLLEPSTYSESLPSSAASTCSPLGSVDHRWSDTAEPLESTSDDALYHHYLQHTIQTLGPDQQGQSALQTDLPKLALENRTIFHSILAVSAACKCCDMISQELETSTSAVRELLMVGYGHYSLASEQMRESMSRPDTLNPDHLLASAVFLVPFATASQKINHWISTRNETESCSTKLLSTTPRDVIVIMRGIQTTLHTLYCGTLVSNLSLTPEADPPVPSPSMKSSIASPLPRPRTHVMNAIIATTSQSAFSQLQRRLDFASFHHIEGYGEGLEVCKAAFKTLDHIRTRAFSSTEKASKSAPTSPPLPQMPLWLQSFARRASNPLPHETLTSFFLNFLVKVPQAYLDLVLPLLERRLESPITVSIEARPVFGLTAIQALALDIYAHWSVLMFLTEDGSWWIGNLPEVTLAGLVNAYGDDFVSKMVPESYEEPGKWWPGGMLKILQEVNKFR